VPIINFVLMFYVCEASFWIFFYCILEPQHIRTNIYLSYSQVAVSTASKKQASFPWALKSQPPMLMWASVPTFCRWNITHQFIIKVPDVVLVWYSPWSGSISGHKAFCHI
jgi:hypothetical protein